MAVSHEIRDYLPVNYTYLLDTANYNFESDVNYVATIRIKEVVNQEMAKEWVKLLSQCSYVTWRAMRTNPKSGKINVYKSDFRCHHKTRYKVYTSKKLKKNTNCPALLKITVRRTDIKCSRAAKPDPLIKEWPCIVNLSNIHNHELQGAAVLRFRDMSTETRAKIVGMFKIGHSPSSIYHSLEVDVCLEHPDDFHLYESDGATLPSLPKIEHLFRLEFKTEYKRKSVADFVSELEIFMEEWARASGGKYVFGSTEDGRHYMVLCTPLMQRVHELVPQSAEIVLLETVGGMDRQRHRVYFFLTPTISGGLPLGVIITNNKAEDIFNSALNDFLAIISPIPAFYGSSSPKILVTDYLKELKSLPQHFPLTTVVYSQYHVLEHVWTWLKDKSRNKVEEADRQELYSELKSLVHSLAEDDLLSRYQTLLFCSLCIKYPLFKTMLTELWESRLMWASCYRTDLAEGSICANTAFRVQKEALMSRVMAFKLTPLVDFIITRFESYIERKLLMFCTEHRPKCLLRKFLPNIGDIDVENLVVHSYEDGNFLVPCDDVNPSLPYSTNVLCMTCSCVIGKPQKMCKHLSAAVQRIELDSVAFCRQEAMIEKDLLLKVANFNVVTVSSQDFEAIVAGEGLTIDDESESVSPGDVEESVTNLHGDLKTTDSAESEKSVLEKTSTSTVAADMDSNSNASGDAVALKQGQKPVSQNLPENILPSLDGTVPRAVIPETISETSKVDVPSSKPKARNAPSRLFPIQPRPQPGSIIISNLAPPVTNLPVLTLASNMSGLVDPLAAPCIISYALTACNVEIAKTLPSIDIPQCNRKSYVDSELDVAKAMEVDNISDDAGNASKKPRMSALKLSESEFVETRMEPSDKPETVVKDESPTLQEPMASVVLPDSSIGYSIADVAEFMEVVQEDGLEGLNEESLDSQEASMVSDTDEEFELLISRIKEGRKNNPDVFGPAIKKMVLSARKHARSDESLAKALATFGEFPSLDCSGEKKLDTETT